MNTKVSEDIAHIKAMMERSSRFISLSGLSGIGAGITGLIAGLTAIYLVNGTFSGIGSGIEGVKKGLIGELIILGAVALFIALFFGCFFTIRKSRRLGLQVWTSSTKKILIHLAVPLVVGGIFILALICHGLYGLVAGTTLVFYGLALINAGKYTYSDIRYLGALELSLGCISLFWLGQGLALWTLGFGLLHIVYGIILYKKYR